MDERSRRIQRNEDLLRDVNERLRALNEGFSELTGDFEILCECGELDCNITLSVSRADYERVRGDRSLFIVAPGHEHADLEDVIERAPGYSILRKRHRPEGLAATSGPDQP
jgi:hypothetical protein